MNENKYIQHWNYFCSITKQLESTIDYVYPGISTDNEEEIKLIHGDVYSNAFKQIILLASAEFEVLARNLCGTLDKSERNIVEISQSILEKYPKLIETEVITMFWVGRPLKDWSVNLNSKNDKKVFGIDWWDAYIDMKHDKTDSFKKATLKNAVFSVASLFIIHLYLMNNQLEGLGLLNAYPPAYFKCKYEPEFVFAAEGKLPDFGDKSASEAFKEQFD